eukprot:891289-Prymnesium_polylepis.1
MHMLNIRAHFYDPGDAGYTMVCHHSDTTVRKSLETLLAHAMHTVSKHTQRATAAKRRHKRLQSDQKTNHCPVSPCPAARCALLRTQSVRLGLASRGATIGQGTIAHAPLYAIASALAHAPEPVQNAPESGGRLGGAHLRSTQMPHRNRRRRGFEAPARHATGNRRQSTEASADERNVSGKSGEGAGCSGDGGSYGSDGGDGSAAATVAEVVAEAAAVAVVTVEVVTASVLTTVAMAATVAKVATVATVAEVVVAEEVVTAAVVTVVVAMAVVVTAVVVTVVAVTTRTAAAAAAVSAAALAGATAVVITAVVAAAAAAGRRPADRPSSPGNGWAGERDVDEGVSDARVVSVQQRTCRAALSPWALAPRVSRGLHVEVAAQVSHLTLPIAAAAAVAIGAAAITAAVAAAAAAVAAAAAAAAAATAAASAAVVIVAAAAAAA